MTFEQIEARVAELIAQWRAGQITPEQYAAAVNQLRATDAAGYTWQPNPAGQGWLYWDGTHWQPGTPAPIPSGAAPPAAPAPAANAGWQQFRGQLMSPQMFSEVSRKVPLRRRPQAWWDMLAILGGAVCGYFWFVYAAVRGLPRLSFVQYGESTVRDLILDYGPILVLLLVPLLLFVFRRLAMPPLHRLFTSLQVMSVGKKLGCVALFLVVLIMMHTNNFVFSRREGLDLVTPVLMVAIPLGLVWFRKETDRMLQPFQPYLRPIPKIILSIVALAVPFLVGYLLYQLPYMVEYNLLRMNVVIGVLLSYAILRTPEGSPARRPSAVAPVVNVLVFAGLYLLYDLALNADAALADDFLTDPFNLKDGLRTTGIAPVLSGAASAVNILLVNGVELVRNFTGAGSRPWQPHEERQRTDWSGTGRIVSGDGALDWLKKNNMLDKDGRLNDNFRDWYNQLPGDPNPSELEGVSGDIDTAGKGPQSDQITIVLRDPSKPLPGGLPPVDHGDGSDMIFRDDQELVPPDWREDHHEKDPPVNLPPEDEPPVPDPPKETTTVVPPPAVPPPPYEAPPKDKQVEDTQPVIPKPPQSDLDDQARRDAIDALRSEAPPSMMSAVQGAHMGDSLEEMGRKIYKTVDNFFKPARDALKGATDAKDNWYDKIKRTYGDTEKSDRILRDLLNRGGLYDMRADSPFMQGVQKAMQNAGSSKEFTREFAKLVEARDAQGKRIAGLATEVLRVIGGVHQGATTGVEFGVKTGAVAGVHDYAMPDPAEFVEKLVLKQQGNYVDARDAWRRTQGLWDRVATSDPTTAQEVDALIRKNELAQRPIKQELGGNMDKMRADSRMRDLWAENTQLRNLRNQVADLNKLKGALR